jgi:GxxExxY protein
MELLFREEAYRIVGAAMEVYNEKGCGFLEGVYQECLEIELALRAIPADAQLELSLAYKGRPLRQVYRVDVLCFGEIIVEVKAVAALVDEHRAQLLNYLNATGKRLGLLINFGHYPGLEWERIVN